MKCLPLSFDALGWTWAQNIVHITLACVLLLLSAVNSAAVHIQVHSQNHSVFCTSPHFTSFYYKFSLVSSLNRSLVYSSTDIFLYAFANNNPSVLGAHQGFSLYRSFLDHTSSWLSIKLLRLVSCAVSCCTSQTDEWNCVTRVGVEVNQWELTGTVREITAAQRKYPSRWWVGEHFAFVSAAETQEQIAFSKMRLYNNSLNKVNLHKFGFNLVF